MTTELNQYPLMMSHDDLSDIVSRARLERNREFARLIKAGFARVRQGLHVAPTHTRAA